MYSLEVLVRFSEIFPPEKLNIQAIVLSHFANIKTLGRYSFRVDELFPLA